MWSKILTVNSNDLQLWRKFQVYLLLSTLLFLAFVRFSDADDVVIRIFNRTRDDYHVISINNGPLNSSYYNSSCISIIYTPGYNGKPDGNITNTSLDGMLYYKNNICCANVLLLDYSKLVNATQGIGEIGMKLEYAAKGPETAVTVGKRFGQLLLYWAANFNFSLACLHLIGHSLGAHVFGNTGREVKNNGNGTLVFKITGLDAAAALYGTGSIFQRLDNTCARIVEAVHTDITNHPETSKHYGINVTYGHYDFWPNFFTSEDDVQEGCSREKQEFMSPAALCSHNRAPEMYAYTWHYQTCCFACLNGKLTQNQTVSQNETESQTLTFQASKAPNYYAWLAGNSSSSVIVIGACGNCNATGNHYLTITGTYPYAKGLEGAYP